MKTAVIICLLAIFCTVDATILKILLMRVRNAKSGVENTIRKLERLRDDVKQDTDMTIMKKWTQQIEEHSSYMNSMLNAIHKEVEKAKAKGKNAQPCYDAALETVKNIDYNAYTEARKCQQSAKCSIKDKLDFIDELILNGRGLMADLDDIFPYCYENNPTIWDFFKLRACVVKELDVSNGRAKNFQNDAKNARTTAAYASSVVAQRADECYVNVYSNAHSKLTAARMIATRCIDEIS